MTDKQHLSFQMIMIMITFSVFSCSGYQEKTSDALKAYKDMVFTEHLRCTEGWIAGDGAFSIPVDEDRSLWLFGDSYMDSYDMVSGTVPCLFQARNAAMLMNISNPAEKITLRNPDHDRTLFTYGHDRNYWFWPSSGFTSRDTIYIFQSRIRATGDGGIWGFAGVDTNYVAKIPVDDLSVITYSILPGRDSINFGLSFIDKGRFTYVYGIKSNGFGNDLFAARFRKGDIYSPWSYFDGQGWSSDISRIKKIYSEFTASFWVCRIGQKYVLLTTEFSVNCDQGKNVYSCTADSPSGPFNDKRSIWQVDDTLNGHYPFFYAVAAHPEFDNDRRELLVTYSINGYGECLETCINGRMDPDVYRPKAVRVPYSLLDENL